MISNGRPIWRYRPMRPAREMPGMHMPLWRFCKARQRMNHHWAHHQNNTTYLCGCMPGFRLPGGDTGPKGFPHRKARSTSRQRAQDALWKRGFG